MLLSSRAMQLVGPTRCAAAARLLRAPPQQATAPQRQSLQARAYNDDAAAEDGGDAGQQPYSGPPVFTRWAVYKGKGALNLKPVRPRWVTTEGGGWQMDKEGCLTFEMANAMGERRYDWGSKIVVALNPNELSAIVTDPRKEHTFYHDTFKGQPGREGSLVKTLKWSPADNGFFISASMTDKTRGEEKKSSVSCSLTPAEYTIFEQLVRGSMTHMYGFDIAFAQM